jgi:hypothetical protein
MAAVAAETVKKVLSDGIYTRPGPLRGIHKRICVKARLVETVEEAERKLQLLTEQWQQAQDRGDDPAAVRIAKSYVDALKEA